MGLKSRIAWCTKKVFGQGATAFQQQQQQQQQQQRQGFVNKLVNLRF
jgi:hypothetical protein